MCTCVIFFFFKQKTAYEIRISDWSSDVCSSDLKRSGGAADDLAPALERLEAGGLSVSVETPQSVDDLRGRIRDSGPATVILAGCAGTMNAAAPALRALGPTGRASCRARLCQYM